MSGTSIRDTLDALAPLRDRLNDQDTKIAQLIGVIEQALRRRVNVRISTDIGDGRALAFGKHKGQWQLIVEGSGASTPLLTPAAVSRPTTTTQGGTHGTAGGKRPEPIRDPVIG
jgi:hypothetical protein